MPVNSNYVSIVRGFTLGGGTNISYYKAASAGLAGSVGIWKVTFMVHTTERGQLQIELNGADLPETVATNANPTTGGHPISQSVYITTTVPDSVLAIVNCAGNATALTITPADGNLTHAAAQTLLIEQVA
jgi:hypothetical protein